MKTTRNYGGPPLVSPFIIDNGNGSPPDPDLFIGANPQSGANSREWWGEIDDVAQWDRVLLDSEIEVIHQGGVSGLSSGTSHLNHWDAIAEPLSLTLFRFGFAGIGLRCRR